MSGVRPWWVFAAMVAAVIVRLPAVTGLEMDADEPVYLAAATVIAIEARTGGFEELLRPQLNPEHPALVKGIHAVAISGVGPDADLVRRLGAVRVVSMTGGVLSAGLMAAVHPVAGIALATHTLHAKYSSQGYLEALPGLWMMLAMVLGWRWRNVDVGPNRPVLVAALWGAAAAGKWIHALPGLVLLGLAARRSLRKAAALGLMAALSTWLLDPSLWLAPVKRLGSMLRHHQSYAVAPTDWWAPLSALSGVPSDWHPTVFPLSIDALWLVLGITGIVLGLRDKAQRAWSGYLLAWLGLGLLFLMLWPTRWPQHATILVVPLCFGVGLAADSLSRAIRRFAPNGSSPPASG